MGDTYTTTPGSEGFKEVIDFRSFLEEQRNALTGRKYKLVKSGKVKLPDGSEQDQYLNELQEPDVEIQILNDAGAEYIIDEERKFFNKHTAMGKLVTDERCRRMAAGITNNIVAEIISTPSKYGVTEEKYGSLLFRMGSTRYSIYMFLTAVRDGAIISFGASTTGSTTTYSVTDNANAQNSGLASGRR